MSARSTSSSASYSGSRPGSNSVSGNNNSQQQYGFSQNSNSALTPTQQRLLARVKEVQLFAALDGQAAGFAEELERLSQQTDLLADGSQAVAAALQNWHAVFRTTSMALSALAERDSSQSPSTAAQSHTAAAEYPEQLVRIPVQQDQQQQSTRSRSEDAEHQP